MYIDTGSTINLTCIVKHLPEPPPGIYWTHNGEVGMKLNFWNCFHENCDVECQSTHSWHVWCQRTAWHLNLFMNKSPSNLIKFSAIDKHECTLQEINYDSPRGGVSVITEKGDITTSYLLIQRARSSDSGKYVCLPSNANSQQINVHVLNGKY